MNQVQIKSIKPEIRLLVKLKDTSVSSEFETLEKIINDLCPKFNFRLYVEGWTRKTFDIYLEQKKLNKSIHLARIESLATSNGEIHVFDDRAMDFANELGQELEKAFELKEATVIKEKRPEY